MLDSDSMDRRRLAIAVIVTICLGSPMPAGNDTEADAVIAALCIGIGFACAGAASLRIRAIANVSERVPLAPRSCFPIDVPYRIASSNPGHSPPLSLRI